MAHGMSSFNGFDLLPTILTTLKKERLKTPTDIQQEALPRMLRGESVVGIAETGSGKTLAYALPILQALKQLELNGDAVSEPGCPRAVVIVPTSDLGEQVAKVLKLFTHDTRVRVRSVLGGNAKAIARRNVSGPFEILLATPGRLEQLMDLRVLSLSDMRILVIDEADLLLDAGFLPTVKRVSRTASKDCQMGLFSATASNQVQDLIKTLFRDAHVIETKGRHRVVSTLKTDNRTVVDGKRFPVLKTVLAEQVDGGTLLFVNTRAQCDKLAELLDFEGYRMSIYRGDMDKKERRANLQRFRDGSVELLICTDMAARGLDVEHVDRVINYHLPKEMANYLHRVGRTARAGRKGTVVNLVTERDQRLVERLDSVQSR